jgi:phosphate transport system substrate-binding protein
MSRWALLAAVLLIAALSGCGGSGDSESGDRPDRGGDSQSAEERLNERLEGTVRIGGPPALGPLITGAAANFETETEVEVQVSDDGTDPTLRALCAGRLAVAGSTRPLSNAERAACERRGIDPVRLPAGYLAVAVAASSELEGECLSLPELSAFWDAGAPDRGVSLFGARPGTAAFELFTARVNGRAGRIAASYMPVPNRGAFRARLAEDRALGFFNLSQLRVVDPDDLRLVEVEGDDGCAEPSVENVRSGTYPLAQPLYLYVSEPALEQLRVRSFVAFLVENYPQLSAVSPGIVPASQAALATAAEPLPDAPAPGG